MSKDIYPCLVKDHKVLFKWKKHEDFDKWCKENYQNYPEYYLLFKSFHRAFQIQRDYGTECSQDCPTLILSDITIQTEKRESICLVYKDNTKSSEFYQNLPPQKIEKIKIRINYVKKIFNFLNFIFFDDFFFFFI